MDIKEMNIVSEKEIKIYDNYLKLISYNNYIKDQFCSETANQMYQYANRDMSFPLDFTIKG